MALAAPAALAALMSLAVHKGLHSRSGELRFFRVFNSPSPVSASPRRARIRASQRAARGLSEWLIMQQQRVVTRMCYGNMLVRAAHFSEAILFSPFDLTAAARDHAGKKWL